MEPKEFEILRQRMMKLERRIKQMLGLGLVGVCALIVALTLVLSTHKASADPNFQSVSGQVFFFIDDRTGATCYVVY